MDFSLTDEQRMFQDLFRDFAQRQVAPLADALDREERTPIESIEKAAELELLGLPFPAEYGGSGVGFLVQCLLVEELAKACFSTALTLGVHTGAAGMALYLGGGETQKKKYLSALARGEVLGAFALSEPWAGSDAASLRTRASRDGDGYRLNGEKAYVTNGEIADLFIIYAATDPQAGARGISAFIVEKGTPGLKVGQRERTMGLRGACINSLTLADCHIPDGNLLGEEGSGFEMVQTVMGMGRLGIAAQCVGIARAA
ncbi:MAG: acyl-CoA dehydrogenase family protein, partial [Chloroflexi bacterium]|nr:acyl-CoA dehydrogenase family protein [Chloroflexota bacterium]